MFLFTVHKKSCSCCYWKIIHHNFRWKKNHILDWALCWSCFLHFYVCFFSPFCVQTLHEHFLLVITLDFPCREGSLLIVHYLGESAQKRGEEILIQMVSPPSLERDALVRALKTWKPATYQNCVWIELLSLKTVDTRYHQNKPHWQILFHCDFQQSLSCLHMRLQQPMVGNIITIVSRRACSFPFYKTISTLKIATAIMKKSWLASMQVGFHLSRYRIKMWGSNMYRFFGSRKKKTGDFFCKTVWKTSGV